MKINANINALQTARFMNRTNDILTKSTEKLSSGYKINSVSDDPTGTAVSSKIKAQLYGLRLASNNAADGVSLVQTAEAAMSEVHEMLKRMRELAVQSANDSNAPEDRLKIQTEIDQLVESIGQMADVTEFNQMKLLNGSLSNLTTVSRADSATDPYALNHDLDVVYMSPNFPAKEYLLEIAAYNTDTNTSVTASYLTTGGTIQLNNDIIEIAPGESPEVVREKILELADRYDCNVEFSGTSFTLTAKEAGEKVKLELQGTSISPTNPVAVSGTSAAVTLPTDSGFSSAATVKVEGNRIFITEGNGTQLQIDIDTMLANDGVYKIKIEDKGQLKLQTGANEDQRIALMIPGLTTDCLGLTKKDFSSTEDNEQVSLVCVKNRASAEKSIALLDEAITKVSTMRSTLGAYQNRLEHTIKSIDINATNTETSLSRIQDTDMALEMSSYTLNNVILQSAISMLSHANERPQQLLQLLR